MPYIKTKRDPMKTLLKGEELNGPSLAKLLGCTPPTAKRKLDSPELLTLGDLRKINRYAHIPIDKIREAI